MQGASALQKLLDEEQAHPLSVIIVWEPVLLTDLGPPLSSVLSRVSDVEAVQLWDEGRTLSAFLVESVNRDPSLLAPGDSLPADMIVWDIVAVFPPGAIWSTLPRPAYYGGPVVDVMDQVRSTLAAATP